jgi:glycine reductase
MYGKLTPAGDGKTLALRGVLVTELYPLKANFKGMMDMSGPAADRSMLARHIHIILDLRPKEGTSAVQYCAMQKQAALTIAVWLAELGIGHEIDETVVYELTPVDPAKKLPKVAYLMSQWSGFDTQEFFWYGQKTQSTLPFPCHPNEILDGAMIYAYMGLMYSQQEEAMIKELYNRHGKDIEFVGMIVTVGKTETTAKNVSSMIAAEFAKDYLKADITINTVRGMGHCQLEQQMMHIWSEELGMKDVMLMTCVSSEKPGDRLVISDPRCDAVIHAGRIDMMECPYMERLIGVPEIPALLGIDLHGPFINAIGGGDTSGANFLTEDLNLKTTGWNWPKKID